MKEIHVKEAVGQALCHDIVRIVIGEVKDTPFKRGHIIREEDVALLLQLGKEHIYVLANTIPSDGSYSPAYSHRYISIHN